MKRTGPRLFMTSLVALPLLTAVLLMASRVGEQARFVTWPVVAFTALGAVVAVFGVWSGSRQPALLAAGLLPAVVVSYFLPAAPFPFIAAVLVGLGGLAHAAGGLAPGVAAGTATLMVVFVVLQGPAVECGESSVSTSGGPWWIDEPSESSGSGTVMADGGAGGSVQIGQHHYSYTCDNARLSNFERLTETRGAPGD